VGELPAVELVTVGQRRGLGAAGFGPVGLGTDTPERRYVVDVDSVGATVTVGPLSALMVRHIRISDAVWVDAAPAPGEDLSAQMSAHGQPVAAQWSEEASTVLIREPVRRVAAGQSVVLYRGDAVVGGGVVA
jgi:tRNA-specific 2-thiouridylase